MSSYSNVEARFVKRGLVLIFLISIKWPFQLAANPASVSVATINARPLVGYFLLKLSERNYERLLLPEETVFPPLSLEWGELHNADDVLILLELESAYEILPVNCLASASMGSISCI